VRRPEAADVYNNDLRRTRRLLVAIQVLFVVVALEALLHIYNPIPFRVRGNRIDLRRHQVFTVRIPGATKVDPVVQYRTNALGFRGPEPPADFDRHLSIVAIGGSTTGCFLLNDADTWPDQLHRRLGDRFPTLWTNNAGIDGQSTYGHLVLLRDYVSQIRPNVALFLVGLNDVALAAANWFDEKASAPALTVRETLTEWFVSHTELVALAQNAWRARQAQRYGLATSEMRYADLPVWTGHSGELEERSRHFRPAFEQRVVELVRASRAARIEPVLITQPALYGEVADPSTGIDFSNRRVNDFANGDEAWRALENYNDATRRVAERENVLLIDLARRLPRDSRYYSDLVHFSKTGAGEVAEIVSSSLVPTLERFVARKRE
jgi:lysophospholipase L1-like esterase